VVGVLTVKKHFLLGIALLLLIAVVAMPTAESRRLFNLNALRASRQTQEDNTPAAATAETQEETTVNQEETATSQEQSQETSKITIEDVNDRTRLLSLLKNNMKRTSTVNVEPPTPPTDLFCVMEGTYIPNLGEFYVGRPGIKYACRCTAGTSHVGDNKVKVQYKWDTYLAPYTLTEEVGNGERVEDSHRFYTLGPHGPIHRLCVRTVDSLGQQSSIECVNILMVPWYKW
jgi:hypothetical protein